MSDEAREPEADGRLPYLYDSAGNLEEALGRIMNDPNATLTPGHIGAFNQILADARAILPDSVALREDVAEVDAATSPADAHHALRTTIVPTLHNALPPDAYEQRR